MSNNTAVSPTFAQAAKDALAAAIANAKTDVSLACVIATLYAVGFLSKMTKKEINLRGQECSGATDAQWSLLKSYLSMAHRSIAGEYGFGEWLAVQWAKSDFTVLTLRDAYDKTGGPKVTPDVVESLARKLAQLSALDVQSVMTRYCEIAEVMAYAHNDVQAIISQNINEILSASPKVENKILQVA